MKIGIVGAGLIGSYLAGCLASRGNRVTLLVRRGSSTTKRQFLVSPRAKRSLLPKTRPIVTVDPLALEDVDACIIAVKSRDVREAAEVVAGVLPPSAPVVSVQNGLRAIDELRRILGKERVAMGVVAFNVVEVNGSFLRATPGAWFIGKLSPPYARPIAELVRCFRGTGQRVREVLDIDSVARGKLLLNLVNGLSAATGLTLSQLIASRDARLLYADAIEEGLDVLARVQLPTRSVARVPVRFIPFMLRLPDRLVRRFASRIGGVSQAARSSTLSDLERGHPTEVSDLNGAIVELGQALSLPTPVNAVIVDVVSRIEREQRDGRVGRFVSPRELRNRSRAYSYTRNMSRRSSRA